MVFGNQNGVQERSTPPIEVTAEATPALPLLNVKRLVPSRCGEASLAQSLIAPPQKSGDRFHQFRAFRHPGDGGTMPHPSSAALVPIQAPAAGGGGAAQG